MLIEPIFSQITKIPFFVIEILDKTEIVNSSELTISTIHKNKGDLLSVITDNYEKSIIDIFLNHNKIKNFEVNNIINLNSKLQNTNDFIKSISNNRYSSINYIIVNTNFDKSKINNSYYRILTSDYCPANKIIGCCVGNNIYDKALFVKFEYNELLYYENNLEKYTIILNID
jgi:hypothetical protein